MKKIFFNVSCLVLLATGVLACSGQGKKDKESKTNERSTGEDKYQETNRTAQMGTEL